MEMAVGIFVVIVVVGFIGYKAFGPKKPSGSGPDGGADPKYPPRKER